MSDQAPARQGGGWFKTLLGTFAGLLSGAVMMYLSPLLDKVIKPGKPLANFAADPLGLTVTFHNRSLNFTEGWWDFGDGSPLEPAETGQDVVTHTYTSPGTYTVKLLVRNFLGEEGERSVNLQLDPQRSEPPQILALTAEPVSPGSFAPATFRVTAKAKGADLSVWCLDSDRPLEINADNPNDQERLVTFTRPGSHLIKVAVIRGKQADERSQVVYVQEPPSGNVAVLLHVTDSATRVLTDRTVVPVTLPFPPGSKVNVVSINRLVPARQGFEVATATLEEVSDPTLKNLRVQVAADRKSVQLLGELHRPATRPGTNQQAPTPLVKIRLEQQQRKAVTRGPVPVMASLAVPGTVSLAMPPLPKNWVDVQRQVRLEIRDGSQVLWQEPQLPRGIPVTVQGRRLLLTAAQASDQVRVELSEVKTGLRSAAR